MIKNFIKIVFLFVFCAAGAGAAFAQADASTSSGRPNPLGNDTFPETFLEGLAKRRIKAEEKEYEDLIARGEEAVKISDELTRNYEQNKNLTVEDAKKIERLEKVVKKIREDLGAKDDDERDAAETVAQPFSVEKLLSSIRETTTEMLSALRKTSRHSISVVAIQSSNSLLKLVRFARFNRD